MPFDIDSVRQCVPNRRIAYFDVIDSTMQVAAELAEQGCISGTVVIADEQTAGQGRHGHTWHSALGLGLYVSIVLPKLPVLTLALGLSTASAIAEVTGLSCDLRWPNDVLIDGKKAAGILVQLTDSAAIAGIGVNVNHDTFPAEIASQATSLRLESGQVHSRENLVLSLFPAIDRFCHIVEEGGAKSILDLFAQKSSFAKGKRVVVNQGGSVLVGTTAGLDSSGFLIVRKDDGSQSLVLAGGVRAAGD